MFKTKVTKSKGYQIKVTDKIKITKNVLISLSRAPIYHSFTFNLQFLCNLKHKFRPSKGLCGIFHFRLRFIFIKVFNKKH